MKHQPIPLPELFVERAEDFPKFTALFLFAVVARKQPVGADPK